MNQAWACFKQMLNVFPHHMQTNEVLAPAFFEGLEYNARSFLNSAAGGQAMSITSEVFFDLLDKLSKGNEGYEGDTSRTTTQRDAGILYIDQTTNLNAKIDAKQHTMTAQFKQLALNQAALNVVQQTVNWCGVCGSAAHETEQCEANPNSVNYVGNMQRGQSQQNYGNSYNPSWRNHSNFSWGGNQNQKHAQGATNTESKGLDNNTRTPTKKHPNVPNELSETSCASGKFFGLASPSGLPGDTELNLRQLHDVSTRSGLQLEELAPRKGDNEVNTKEKKVEEVVKSPNVEEPVHIDLPLLDVLLGIPKYAKYVKEIVASKRKLIEYETVALTEECSSRNSDPSVFVDADPYPDPDVDTNALNADVDFEFDILESHLDAF
ncbi:uncharacterized protein [Solanum lycopersicum]|uniref:uncharacterized protein n=1 Tax=Solanum lycopersicum TaxID=4081 RepID=UPI0002BCB8BA|nr:uncharacterized protein LOC101256902 [Solanum lycopersicum]